MKLLIKLLIITAVFTLSLSTAFSQDTPEITAFSAVLINAKTGQVLYGKNMHKPMHPASTSKIMTAIIALEHGNLNDIVTASKNATRVIGTRIYLEAGEELTLHQLLYALLLRSANDAAIAIAEHIAGSVENFVKMMNAKAKELGCKNTNFTNPHGLTHENHLISAYDMALIASYAMKNETFRKIVSTHSFTIPWKDKDYDRLLVNTNDLLRMYKGTDGIKTGYTSKAGQTIVASAIRGNNRLICVLFRSQGKNLWYDAIKLLDYGFENFDFVSSLKSGKIIKIIPVKYGGDVALVAQEDFNYVVSEESKAEIQEKLVIMENITAPIKKGQVLGKIEYFLEDKKIGEVNLVAQKGIRRKFYTYPSVWILSLIGFLTILLFLIKFKKKNSMRKTKINYISVQKLYYRK